MSNICQLYKNGKSARQIASLIGVSYQTVLNELHRNNIKIRYSQKGPIDKDFLVKEYVINKKSTYIIAKEINQTASIVGYWLKKYNIKARTASDYPNPMLNKKRPDISLRNKINSGKKHPFYNKKRPEFSAKIRGKNHPNWKGGISSRTDKLRHKTWNELKLWGQIILGRDDYTCRNCNKRGCDLEVHHIFPIGRFPQLILEPNNGVTLCKKCHIRENTKSIKNLKDPLFKENEVYFRIIELHRYLKGDFDEKSNTIGGILKKLG